MKNQFLGVNRLPEPCLDFEARHSPFEHCLVEHGKTCFAVDLGVIHGGVRIAQQIFRSVARRTHSDPYADTGENLPSLQIKRQFELVQYALCDKCGFGFVTNFTEENREFVASEPGNHRLPIFPSGANTRLQSPGNPHQQLIARRVPQAVVYKLEAV
jgi:hypothetical protein